MTDKNPILVVDDDPDFASGLAEILEVYGFDSQVVHSGEEALEACSKHEYLAVLMDVKMQGMNGVEAFFTMKRGGYTMPVILISAYSEEELLAQAIQAGAAAVMQKPFDPTRLMNLLERLRPGPNLLLVDDDQDFLASIQQMFSHQGYQVHTASKGSDALKLSESTEFDMILLDVLLPDIMGPELIKLLRKNAPNAPVCYLTAFYREHKDILDAISSEDVFRKPFEPKMLLQKVEELIDSKNEEKGLSA